MPPKRRNNHPKAPSAPPRAPPPPPESEATRVRKEWSKFVDAWYEPQKKKLVEKLQRDLLVKYKNLGSAKETQKLREMELFEKLDCIAQQLAQPARSEWERRLDLAQLREDQWDDMSGEEQQAVMSVFVGFFADDVEDMDDAFSEDLSSAVEEEDSLLDDHPSRATPAPLAKQPIIPPTPTRQTFEFVNPTSFFAHSVTPPHPTKKLPALSMDHLATLGPSIPGRSAEPVSANVSGMPGFQNWASEAGIVTQQPQTKPATSTASSSSTQPLSARPRATDNISRQASGSSPPLKISSPQYSPSNPTTKFSPPINADTLPLGKRYIGPIISEEEPDPLDEELLKSKMADEYQQYKISLRIQMIYQFHAEAAEVEIKLFEALLSDHGTKEGRARAVQEHETSMMRLRDQKEEERKRLCAEEREKRREEIRQHLAQRRPPQQNREVDPVAKPKPSNDKTSSVPQRPSKATTHQKENIPLAQPPVASSSKLEPPGAIKKSISSLSQDEASANEAVFANAMAMMAQGKASTPGLTPAQASFNEAIFSSAAATLASLGQPVGGAKIPVQAPGIMKKSSSSRSPEHDVPQITISFAEPAAPPVTAPPRVPAVAIKGKKGKKGQLAVQPPPAKPIVLTEQPEMEMDAEPPPPEPSLWDAAAVVKNAWGALSASTSAPKSPSAEEERNPNPTPTIAPAPSKGTKKAGPAAKKGKRVTITEEPDVDADPIVSQLPSAKTKVATRGGWGKSKATPPVVEESRVEPVVPSPPPPTTSVRGKKTVVEAPTKHAQKPQLKVAISEEAEGEVERNPVPARTSKAKTAWQVPAVTPIASTSTQAAKKVVQQQQAETRRGPAASGSKSVRVDMVQDPEDAWPGTAVGGDSMPGALESEEEDESEANAWFKPENLSYWANVMGGQPETEPQPAPPAAEQPGTHARWTPTANEESEDEDEFGEGEEELATNMWMEYAISGGDMPALGGALEEPPRAPSGIAQRDASLWEQGRGRKNSTTGDFGSRVQQTSSVFDRAALTGQWPKMESWLSPPSRGQNSGSTRVF